MAESTSADTAAKWIFIVTIIGVALFVGAVVVFIL